MNEIYNEGVETCVSAKRNRKKGSEKRMKESRNRCIQAREQRDTPWKRLRKRTSRVAYERHKTAKIDYI